MKKLILFTIVSILFSSCAKELEPYDNPFLYLTQNGASSARINQIAEFVGEYSLCLSSKKLEKELTVDYSITAGDGLKENVDYRIITQGRQITFYPGIYDMSIRILWLPATLDPDKDNTLTIKIESNSMDFTMGLPGPNALQRSFIITKY